MVLYLSNQFQLWGKNQPNKKPIRKPTKPARMTSAKGTVQEETLNNYPQRELNFTRDSLKQSSFVIYSKPGKNYIKTLLRLKLRTWSALGISWEALPILFTQVLSTKFQRSKCRPASAQHSVMLS